MSQNDCEAEKKKKAENARWLIAFIIWGIGAAAIFMLWELQKQIPGVIGELVAFVVYLIAFFYFLALGPIRDWVSRLFGDSNA